MYIQAFINDCTRFGGGSHEAGANCLRTAVEAACLAPVVRRSSAQRSPPPHCSRSRWLRVRGRLAAKMRCALNGALTGGLMNAVIS